MKYNREKTLAAWKTFITGGSVNEDDVRPEILSSWKRCRKYGMDPWSTNYPEKDSIELSLRRQKNQRILELAAPVMQYLLCVFSCNVSISDNECFVYELISPIKSYSPTLGAFAKEEYVGTGNITLAAYTQKPARVEGYEHYRSVSQRYSGVSAPVFFHGQLVAILNINTLFSSLPPEALDICIAATSLISQLLNSSESEIRRKFLTAASFRELIAVHNKIIIIVDQDGIILDANPSGMNIVPEINDAAYASLPLSKYLQSKSSLLPCLTDMVDSANPISVVFKATKKHPKLTLKLTSNRKIYFQNGTIHQLLVFSDESNTNESDSSVGTVYEKHDLCPCISPKWKKTEQTINKISRYNSNVLLLGETGTGKEIAARMIHQQSLRNGNFVAINCGAIPKELLAAELFGYESGAFTGAKSGGSIGKFEYANGGTLFLDEIGEMPLDMQVSLLRVLQERTITRIGGNKPLKFDVRFIAATNQNLNEMIDSGKFRSDLYYRLSVIEINLPPLRDRKDDIPVFVRYFINKLSEELEIGNHTVSPELLDVFCNYEWPGNIRELKNILEKMLIMSESSELTLSDIPEYLSSKMKAPVKKVVSVPSSSQEEEHIISVLSKYNGNLSQAARELQLSRSTLYRRIEKLGLAMEFHITKRS